MSRKVKIILPSNVFDNLFQTIAMLYCEQFSAGGAMSVVVVIIEHVSKFNFVFPANWYPLNDAKFLKQRYNPVDSCSVYRVL